MASEYIREDVQVDVKRRADEQLGAIREKMTKWADKIYYRYF